MATSTINPPLKWHGGKHGLRHRGGIRLIIQSARSNAPEPGDAGWLHYVEPFFGGGSVLLANDPEGISEVANDLNAELAEFWTVMACDRSFKEFHRLVDATPFSEDRWKKADERVSNGCSFSCVHAAAEFFIRCRQSLSGRMKGFAGITRNRTRRGMNEQVSAWLNAIEGLPAVHARLKRVLIRNQPALDIIRKEDGPRTLFYLDPPYCHGTHSTTTEYGDQEMSNADHSALLEALAVVKGRFLLSGYRSDLYDAAAAKCGWRREDKEIHNHAAGGAKKRRMIESVWMNY